VRQKKEPKLLRTSSGSASFDGGSTVPQKSVVLSKCNVIDPQSIDTYLEHDGFKALAKARGEMTPDTVIDTVKASGLMGRGGAGFSTGLKWEFARKAEGDQKYIVCNADEGEMGTFKDRFILQKDPFTLIEAIAIAAFAVGAKNAYIYLRGEYSFLRNRLENAIDAAKKRQFLADIDIAVMLGAGAYVCGEETALMNSMEGRRGEARYRPPFPPQSGLWDSPTIINNVETLMNIPPIVLNGPEWFAKIGTVASKGTKVFSISGDAPKPGVYELELGSLLSELVTDLAGAKHVKMVQIGGAAGRIIPGSQMDIPLAFESILGSGAVMVYDERRDVIDIVYRTMKFFAEESCGKCTPCREGTEVMVEIMERLSKGQGAPDDIAVLEDLSSTMSTASLCGLGQAAPMVVEDTLKYFRRDYETRIEQSVFLRSLGGKRG
jgi:NADH:ubiquinone oxidoreductase subunit F (NADH-binding)